MTETGRRVIMPDLLAGGANEPLEDVICSLVELGVERERIEIVPVGIFRRYRGLLLGYSPAAGHGLEPGRKVTLYVAERALADRMPEGFLRDLPQEGRPESVFDDVAGGFAARQSVTADDDADSAVDPYEEFRRQLDGGRQLLWLLDRALRRARRDIAVKRHALSAVMGDPDFARRLLDILELAPLGGDDHSSVFVAQSLASFQEALGSGHELAAFMQCLLGLPVRAREDEGELIPIPDSLRSRLGGANSRLGHGTVSGACMKDPRPGFTLILGPMGAAEAARRCRDREAAARIAAAAAALVPACRPCRVVYEVASGDRAARPGRAAYAVLGRTTYLGAPARGRALAAASVH